MKKHNVVGYDELEKLSNRFLLDFRIVRYWIRGYNQHPLVQHTISAHIGLDIDMQYINYLPKLADNGQDTIVCTDIEKNTWTPIKPGKMLRKLFPNLSPTAITELTEWWKGRLLVGKVQFTATDDELLSLLKAYQRGDIAIPESCMVNRDRFESIIERNLHPYMAYAHELGWSLAYSIDATGIVARAIVHKPTKTFVQAYTRSSKGISVSTVFSKALYHMGYTQVAGWKGCKLKLLVVNGSLDSNEPVQLMVPFIDGNNYTLGEPAKDGTAKILRSSTNVLLRAKETSGFVLANNKCEYCHKRKAGLRGGKLCAKCAEKHNLVVTEHGEIIKRCLVVDTPYGLYTYNETCCAGNLYLPMSRTVYSVAHCRHINTANKAHHPIYGVYQPTL